MTTQNKILTQESLARFNHDEIDTQLGRILKSRTFKDSLRLQQFLQYVVSQTLKGESKRIKGFTIAQEVFGRGNPDDAQSSTIVRVEAGRLRRHLNDYYLNEGQQDSIRLEIPKGAYVPVFSSNTAEGKKKKSSPAAPPPDTSTPSSSTDVKRFKYFLVIVIALFLTALFSIYLYSVNSHVRSSVSSSNAIIAKLPLKPAIAVLLFSDESSGSIDSKLADGITEDIITDLTKVSGVDVISYSSVLPYRYKVIDAAQIARELNVGYILRGSIRGTPTKLRITAQLYQTASGNQVWAQRFDMKLDNILELQDELAVKIVEGMSVNLRGDERRRIGARYTSNAEAYSLYKQAMNLANPPSDPGRLIVVRRAFERVTQLAPDFAGGYAGTAYTYAFFAWWGHSKNPKEDLEKAFSLSEKARALDPYFGLTYSAIAFAHLAQGNFTKALESSKKGIVVQPSDPYVNAYHGFLLGANGNATHGIDYVKRALRLDPLFPRTPFLNILGVIYFHSGQYQKAIDAFSRNIERGGPDSPGIQAYRAATKYKLGQIADAKTTYQLFNLTDRITSFEKWLKRSFKQDKDIELVLSAMRMLDK
ncbi:hypothetical protein ACFL17_03175 [Pseudomonadota bacterium]